MSPPPPRSTLFPYTTLFRSHHVRPDVLTAARPGPHVVDRVRAGSAVGALVSVAFEHRAAGQRDGTAVDRKSTRLNSSHMSISYAVFCLKKKNMKQCAANNLN